MLATIEFVFENYQLLCLAVLEYEHSNIDLSDVLIGKINHLHGCKHTVSFDKRAISLEEFFNANDLE